VRGTYIGKEEILVPDTMNDRDQSESLGLAWIDCPYPVAAVGLARILESEALVHVGKKPPEETPSVAIFGVGSAEGLLEGIKRIRKQSPSALILIFGLYLDLDVAQSGLRAGARGFIHAGMKPEQIVRAVRIALEGEIVAPRQLLEYLITTGEDAVDLHILSNRQREILKHVDEGLTNAQIAKRLFLTESTVKQHLRGAFKILGVSNRTEAAKLMRNGG
jgi:DNA-binding NarL/FixJ family response regulator